MSEVSPRILKMINEEVELDHFLVKDYRIAAVNGDSHGVNYIVCVVVDSIFEKYFPGTQVAEVTREEAELLNIFQTHLLEDGFFFGKREAEDITMRGPVNYASFNGYTFIKNPTKGWGYHQWTWRNSNFYPFEYAEHKDEVMTLAQLLNHINQYDRGWVQL